MGTSEIHFMDSIRVLVNEKCIPRNQAIFVNMPKTQATQDLRSFIGHFNRYTKKPVQLYIGSCKYQGKASLCRRRFNDLEYDLLIMITAYKFHKDYSGTGECNKFPLQFTQAEICWVNR